MEHPFSFFIDLIQAGSLFSIEGEFFSPLSYPPSTIAEFNKKEGYIIYNQLVNEEDFAGKLYFKDYLERIFKNEVTKVLKSLDLILMPLNTDQERKRRLEFITKSITYNIDILKSDSQFTGFKYLVTWHEDLIQTIEKKYKVSLLKRNYSINSSIDTPIVWLGQLKVLATLFYELNYTTDKKGHRYIQELPNLTLANIISQIFVDKKGNSISAATMDKVMRDEVRRADSAVKINLNNMEK